MKYINSVTERIFQRAYLAKMNQTLISKHLDVKRTIQLTAENIDPIAAKKEDVKIDIVSASSFLKYLV